MIPRPPPGTPPIAGMGPAPLPDPFHMVGTTEVIPILRLVQPSGLAGPFTGLPACALRTISCVGRMGIRGEYLFATQTDARGSIPHAWPFQKRPAFVIHRGVKSKDKSSDRCWSIRWQKKIRKDFYDSLGTIDFRRISTFNPPLFGSFRTALGCWKPGDCNIRSGARPKVG